MPLQVTVNTNKCCVSHKSRTESRENTLVESGTARMIEVVSRFGPNEYRLCELFKIFHSLVFSNLQFRSYDTRPECKMATTVGTAFVSFTGLLLFRHSLISYPGAAYKWSLWCAHSTWFDLLDFCPFVPPCHFCCFVSAVVVSTCFHSWVQVWWTPGCVDVSCRSLEIRIQKFHPW